MQFGKILGLVALLVGIASALASPPIVKLRDLDERGTPTRMCSIPCPNIEMLINNKSSQLP